MESFVIDEVLRLEAVHASEVALCTERKQRAWIDTVSWTPAHAIEVDPYPVQSLHLSSGGDGDGGDDGFTLRLFPSDFVELMRETEDERNVLVLDLPDLDLSSHWTVLNACEGAVGGGGRADDDDDASSCRASLGPYVVQALRNNRDKIEAHVPQRWRRNYPDREEESSSLPPQHHHWPTHGPGSESSREDSRWSPWLVGCSASSVTADPERAALDAAFAFCHEAVTCTADEYADVFIALRAALRDAFAPGMERIGREAGTDKITDHGYHLSYERFLAPLRAGSGGGPIRLLEIGLERGSSVELWRRYFTNGGSIHGIDISVHPDCRLPVLGGKSPGGCGIGEGVTLFSGDGGSEEFLNAFADHIIAVDGGPYHVIVDDGSHVPAHQLAAFRCLFSRLLRPGGVYIIEDVETSYWHRGELYWNRVNAGRGTDSSALRALGDLVDVINRGYWRPSYAGEESLQPSAALVETVQFGRNCVVLVRRTEESDRYDLGVGSPRYHFRDFVDGYYK